MRCRSSYKFWGLKCYTGKFSYKFNGLSVVPIDEVVAKYARAEPIWQLVFSVICDQNRGKV